MKNGDKVAAIIFIFIGMIFVICGVALKLTIFNFDNKIETTGEIIRISDDYFYVLYEVDEREYVSKINGSNSNYYVGKNIAIYYNPDNPNKIIDKDSKIIYILFIGMGSLFAFFGIAYLVNMVRKAKKRQMLRETGSVIYADYVETRINTLITVNNKHPYNIICEYTHYDGVRHKFKSQNLWYDPSNIISEKSITRFPVFVNLDNLKEYVIDTKEIEKD